MVSIIAVLFLMIWFFVIDLVQGDAEMNIGIAIAQDYLMGIFGGGFLIAALVALGLGIGGLRQKEKKKTLAILGTVYSSVGILIVAVIWITTVFI